MLRFAFGVLLGIMGLEHLREGQESDPTPWVRHEYSPSKGTLTIILNSDKIMADNFKPR